MTLPFMADSSAELLPALEAALRADAGVIAAFAPEKVRLYDTPPAVAPKDMPRRYIILGLFQPLPLDGADAAEIEVTLDIWALSDPAGKIAAMSLGAAALACAMALADLPSHTVKSVLPTSAQYLMDPQDVAWGHGVVKFEIVTQPKSNP